MFKEKIEQRKKEKEEKKTELTLRDKENLAKLGADSINRDPYFAGVCLRGAGFSKEETQPLFELAKLLKESKKQDRKPIEEQRELTSREKVRLKELGLTFVAKNQIDAAKNCFKKAGATDEEAQSLLELNLLEIEKEKEKLEEELTKME